MNLAMIRSKVIMNSIMIRSTQYIEVAYFSRTALLMFPFFLTCLENGHNFL
jgi:hypothetical protein